MSSSADTSGFDWSAFDRATVPILNIISVDQARQLAQYQSDETLRQRIDELAAKCNEGELTAGERAEYAAYVRANKFVAILQAQARKVVAGTTKPE